MLTVLCEISFRCQEMEKEANANAGQVASLAI